MPDASPPRVLIAGNPNAGKSTLFNLLCGGRARVGNYPGITVRTQSGRWSLGDETVELVDIPGTYSLTARSPEEQVAVQSIVAGEPQAVVCVVDATVLQRGLYLPLQLIEAGVPTVVALNMIDAVNKSGATVDVEALSAAFGTPVVAISAARKTGIDELGAAVLEVLSSAATTAANGPSKRISYPASIEALMTTLQPASAKAFGPGSKTRTRGMSLWGLLSLGNDELDGVPNGFRASVEDARRRGEADGVDIDLAVTGARYAWIEQALGGATTARNKTVTWSERLDAVLTHKVAGIAVFALVMLLVFEALFRWSEPMIGFIEQVIVSLQEFVVLAMAPGILRDLLVHGVIAGVGNVVVFAPQIMMLFLFIGFLEDSGYLARVAFVIDRVMNGVGLHGRAFVPLLSGFACAVPAVMATRTIENRRDRFVTMLALPLMSCSARLPVFLLVVATVFGGLTVGGVISAGALSLLVMYALSVVFTLGAAAVLRRTLFKGPRPTLVLEMPPYRWPQPGNLWITAWRRLRSFLVDAGTIILAFTILLWALLAFPRDADFAQRHAAEEAAIVQRVAPEERGAAVLTLEAQRSAEQLPQSFAGQLGRAIEPVIAPLGFDWRIGVGIIGAFAAREVFVSTLGMVFGFGDAGDDDPSLRKALREAKRQDGSPLLTPLSGLSLMIFFLLACQCMSTIAAVKRESGSWKWPAIMFAYMTGLAYIASLVVYQGGLMLGFS